jgi:transcription elongation factor SPT6
MLVTLYQFQYKSDEEADSDAEGEDTPTPRKTKKARVTRKKKKSTIYDVYEPSELERGHFLERDTEIRVTDQPERFQIRSIPVQPHENDAELEEEAEWVYEHAFVKLPISKQVGGAATCPNKWVDMWVEVKRCPFQKLHV